MIVRRTDDIVTITMSLHQAKMMRGVYSVAIAAIDGKGSDALTESVQRVYDRLSDGIK
jgi:hypothetical protein